MTPTLCMIALAFLNAHVPRYDRPIRCDMVTASAGDTFTVTGDMPRAWQVVITAGGKPLSFEMPAQSNNVHEVAVPVGKSVDVTIIRPSSPVQRRPATMHLYGGRRHGR